MHTFSRIINVFILILGLGMIAYYLGLGFAVRFGQSLQFFWLIGGIACVLRFAYWQYAYSSGNLPPHAPVLVLRILFGLCLAVFLAVEGIILAGGMAPAPQGLDCIVVLGAKVNGTVPSGSLRNRINVGVEYLNANPDAVAILSGGQGSDEDISEAQCMYDHMTAAGIDPARLILEDQSTDTQENLTFSRELIPPGTRSIGLVTNNFHIYRSLRLARSLGWENVSGVPVATSLLSLPHYLMREFCGVAYELARGNI